MKPGKRIGAVTLTCCALLVLWPTPSLPSSASRRANEKGVARILVTPPSGQGQSNSGSGFKVAPGLYLTNRHVIEPTLNDGFQVWVVPSREGAEPVPARVRASLLKDLALVAIDDVGQLTLAIHPERPRAGDDVWAIGYPGQLDNLLQAERARGAEPAVTRGVVLGYGPKTLPNGAALTQVVHNADIWPGNSGGPLVDDCGRVIGLNSWSQVERGLAQQNMAVSANDLLDFLAENGVAASIDHRACVDGELTGKPAPSSPAAPTPDPKPSAGLPVRTTDSGSVGAIAALLVILAALGAGGVYVAYHKRPPPRRDPADAYDEREW